MQIVVSVAATVEPDYLLDDEDTRQVEHGAIMVLCFDFGSNSTLPHPSNQDNKEPLNLPKDDEFVVKVVLHHYYYSRFNSLNYKLKDDR